MPRRPSTAVPSPDPQVYRISSAPHRHSDDLSTRMSRYLISMAVRTACVVLVVVVHGPLRWVFAVGAILLPYVAVVFANAGRRPREEGPPQPDALRRNQLTAPQDVGSGPGPASGTAGPEPSGDVRPGRVIPHSDLV